MALFNDLLLIVFALATATQLFFWLFVFSKLAFFKKQNLPKDLTNYPSVSVIICARNEAENLTNYLPKILEQDYPDFEVVVVNDDSTDATAEVLEKFAQQYAHLKVITIQDKKLLGKKGALTAGIEAAKNDWLLLTDADCYPLSKNWIAGMLSETQKSKEVEIVLGYAPYERCDNSFLNQFIRFETLWTATQYLGFALSGMPYMAVGRNVLYHKKLYKQVDGFKSHADLASGDDDLFVNQVVTKINFSTFLHEEAFMVSKPKTQWKDYFTQKTRHLSTGKRYLLKHQLVLGLVAISHFFYFVTTFFLIYLNFSTMFVPTSIVVRTIAIWIVYDKIRKRLHESYFSVQIPLLDVVYVLFYLIFTKAVFLRAYPRKWK